MNDRKIVRLGLDRATRSGPFISESGDGPCWCAIGVRAKPSRH